LGQKKGKRFKRNPRTVNASAQRVIVRFMGWRILFFENKDDQTFTVNGERYRTMINDFLWSEVIDMILNDK